MTTLASFRTALAEAFYDAIAGGASNLYFFVGRPQEWDDEEAPDTAVDTVPYLNTVRNDMVFLKKVTTSDCKFMVEKREWTTGTVYDEYDDSYGISVTYSIASVSSDSLNGTFDLSEVGEGWLVEGTNIPTGTKVLSATTSAILLDQTPTGAVTSVTLTNVAISNADNLKEAEFYVVTGDNNVYACLDNNGGAESTVEPTLVQAEPFESVGDGYLWKYMFTVPNSHMDEFGTVTMIPVGAAITPAATGIHKIKVMHGGTGYDEDATVVTVTGDGENCTAEAVILDGVLTGVTVTNPGIGYTYATVSVSDGLGGAGGDLRAILGPVGGHGTNPVRELGSTTLRLSKELSVDDTNQGLAVGNDYRQTGLIKDPLSFSGTENFSGLTASACFLITGGFAYGDVAEDDIVQDTDGNQYRVVSKPASEPVGDVALLVQSLNGTTPVADQVIEYAESNTTLSEVSSPDIDKYSGMILFMDNRVAYGPTDLQLISFKSTLSF